MSLTLDQIRGLPKVALHDHLDGGLRPQTVIDHCRENGHELPTTDPEDLGRWFVEAADSGSLERYLETFAHTVAAMQTPEQLRRVAHEFVLDMAADGVIYAEARYAPHLHCQQGLGLRSVVEAVRDGLDSGMSEAEAAGTPVVARQLLASMRQAEPSLEVARLVVEFRDEGVAGFDIAGPEAGYPPTRFGEAFQFLRRHNAFYTIHAGEGAGPESVFQAVQECGAHRLGHGVRVLEDCDTDADGRLRPGRLAAAVRDLRIPLEVAPSSNLQTGIAETLTDHPIAALHSLGFNVTVNCDNRLMSGTTMSREFWLLSSQLGWTIQDLQQVTEQAMLAAFAPHDERLALLHGTVRPAYESHSEEKP